MQQILITQLIKVIMSMLTPELMRRFADMVLDFVENYVEGTKSTVDDRIVLPLCNLIRTTFDIEDNE